MINAYGGDVNYTWGTGHFVVNSQTSDYWNNAAQVSQFNNTTVDSWVLDATITSQGRLLPGGTLTVYGDGSEPLLQGNLIAGDAGTSWGGALGLVGNDIYKFTFNNMSGTLASDFLALGSVAGIQIDTGFSSGQQDFIGVWSSGFSGAVTDTLTFVPEPSVYPFFAFGILGAGVILQRFQSVRKSTKAS